METGAATQTTGLPSDIALLSPPSPSGFRWQVSDRLLASFDEVTARTAAAVVDWAHVKLERRGARSKRQRPRCDGFKPCTGRGGRERLIVNRSLGLSGSGGGSDEELDALLSWTGSLDYDAYRESWLSLATSTAHPQQSQSD